MICHYKWDTPYVQKSAENNFTILWDIADFTMQKIFQLLFYSLFWKFFCGAHMSFKRHMSIIWRAYVFLKRHMSIIWRSYVFWMTYARLLEKLKNFKHFTEVNSIFFQKMYGKCFDFGGVHSHVYLMFLFLEPNDQESWLVWSLILIKLYMKAFFC